MSLDVYLRLAGARPEEQGSGIFVRENGRTVAITREEWDARFPGREPVRYTGSRESGWVYEDNITHNLNRMAAAAGIYEHLWRPDEIGIHKAGQLIDPLREGLGRLLADPDGYKRYNPPNGWGDYDGFVKFVQGYLRACEKYPGAEVEASR